MGNETHTRDLLIVIPIQEIKPKIQKYTLKVKEKKTIVCFWPFCYKMNGKKAKGCVVSSLLVTTSSQMVGF